MFKLLIFAGTTEGRSLSEALNKLDIDVTVCVATKYGECLMPKSDNITVLTGRLDGLEIENLIASFDMVVDATHPYADIVTKNIVSACKKLNVEYIPMVRKSNVDSKECVYLNNMDEVSDYLNQNKGNALFTTGSKDIQPLTRIHDYKTRVYLRILPSLEAIEKSVAYGISQKNLICMQGPFSTGLNAALLKQYNCSYLVTKDSGDPGGFLEKIDAAKYAKAKTIVIGRPYTQETGLSYIEVLNLIYLKINYIPKPEIYIIGMGMGKDTLTLEAENIISECTLLVGSKRVIDALKGYNKDFFLSYKPDEILEFLSLNPAYRKIAIVFSGDTGFFSGAKNMLQALKEYAPKTICGVSSLAYFCSKIGLSYEDMDIISLHGKNMNFIPVLLSGKKLFLLLDNVNTVKTVCHTLTTLGLGNLNIYIGENLGCADEKISSLKAFDTLKDDYSILSVMIIENECPTCNSFIEIPDKDFIRSNVPMTKSEIRTLSLGKLCLSQYDTLFDIGSGTGSVAVQASGILKRGTIYAIEKNKEALDLIEHNKRKFNAFNIEIIDGKAPDIIENLPAPNAAFIGGSSGHMQGILTALLKLNKSIRIVINVIALESLSNTLAALKELEFKDIEIVQVNISKVEKIGGYSLMKANNPVFIISAKGE